MRNNYLPLTAFCRNPIGKYKLPTLESNIRRMSNNVKRSLNILSNAVGRRAPERQLIKMRRLVLTIPYPRFNPKKRWIGFRQHGKSVVMLRTPNTLRYIAQTGDTRNLIAFLGGDSSRANVSYPSVHKKHPRYTIVSHLVLSILCREATPSSAHNASTIRLGQLADVLRNV